MSPFALKEKDAGEWDFQKQRNLSFPLSWVHWEADFLKMVPQLHLFNSMWSGPLFYKSYHISQERPDKQTLCHETFYKFLLLCMNATLTLGQNHHLFRLLSPWREKLATVLILLWVPHVPWALGFLADASSLPADHLQQDRPRPVLPSWQSQTYLQGCSPAMQEAMAKAWACGQVASTVLRPLLADTKDMSRKPNKKCKEWQLWRHWPKIGGHLSMEAKNNTCYQACMVPFQQAKKNSQWNMAEPLPCIWRESVLYLRCQSFA